MSVSTAAAEYSLSLRLLSPVVPRRCKFVVDEAEGKLSLRMRKEEAGAWPTLEAAKEGVGAPAAAIPAAAKEVMGGAGGTDSTMRPSSASSTSSWMHGNDEAALLLAAGQGAPSSAQPSGGGEGNDALVELQQAMLKGGAFAERLADWSRGGGGGGAIEGWVTPELLRKVSESPVLSKAFADPRCHAAMAEMQRDPHAAVASTRACGHAGVHASFTLLMGDHFVG